MIYQKLELHIAQINKAISICRSKFENHPQKQSIYNNLIELFNAVKLSNYKDFDEDLLANTSFTLDVIFNGIQYLDYNEETDCKLPQKLYVLKVDKNV